MRRRHESSELNQRPSNCLEEGAGGSRKQNAVRLIPPPPPVPGLLEYCSLARLLIVPVLDSLDDVQQVGVRASQPLAEDDQAPRQGVRALDRDPDWNGHVRVSHEVGWPVADTSSAHLYD